MRPRLKSSLLWGLVGALSFLVLHQAWLLFGGEFTSIGAVAGVTALVGAVSAAATYYGEPRLHGR